MTSSSRRRETSLSTPLRTGLRTMGCRCYGGLTLWCCEGHDPDAGGVSIRRDSKTFLPVDGCVAHGKG